MTWKDTEKIIRYIVWNLIYFYILVCYGAFDSALLSHQRLLSSHTCNYNGRGYAAIYWDLSLEDTWPWRSGDRYLSIFLHSYWLSLYSFWPSSANGTYLYLQRASISCSQESRTWCSTASSGKKVHRGSEALRSPRNNRSSHNLVDDGFALF